MDADVAVVGAGPVGSAAALLLARAGLTATVVERCSFPRDKPCGEGLMPAGVRTLAGLGVAMDDFPGLAGVRYQVPDAGHVDGTFAEGGGGRGTRRLLLDDRLAGMLRQAGSIDLLTDCRCTGITPRPDSVLVSTAQGDLRVRWLIAADGLRSPVAKWMGWYRPPRGERYAVVGHLLARGHGYDRVVVTLLSGRELYLAPTGPDELLLAVLGRKRQLRGDGEPVAAAYRRHLSAGHPELADSPHTALRGAGPFWSRPATVARGRVFLVGDAAGFLDPLTGEGMTSGLLAASRLAEMLGSNASDPALHYRRWERQQWRRRVFVTRLALALTGSSGLARRAMRGVRRRPSALNHLLEVNEGSRRLSALSAREWAALAGI